MTRTALTARQLTALNDLATMDAATMTVHGTARYPRFAVSGYDADGQVIPGSGRFVLKTVFAALVQKGAVVQLDDPTRPERCLGYRVA